MRRWLQILPAALLALSACAVSRDKASGAAQPTNAASPQNGVEQIAVTTAQATTREVPQTLLATGNVTAFESSDVAPQVGGQVVATPVDVGAFVRQGDVLARLDTRDAQARLQQARAAEQQAVAAVRQAQARLGAGSGGFNAGNVPEVQAARRQYESAEAAARLAETNARRYENLVETGDVSRSVYDQARTQAETARAQAEAARQQYEVAVNAARASNQGVQGAQAAVEAARANIALTQQALSNSTIRAPFAGYVSARPVAVGEYVTTQSRIATVEKINPVKVLLQLPEEDAGKTRVGLPVTATVTAFPDREFTGRVTAINPALDPNSRAVTVEAQIENPNTLLRPGMFATARIAQPGNAQSVFVPRAAVINDPATNSARVFVVENGKARVRVVQTGEAQGDLLRITAGLSGNEIVITSNLDKLYDGAPVKQ